jgi:hypothetical protein
MTQPTLFDLEAPAACEWCGAEGGGVFELAGKPAPKVHWYATREAFLCEFCHANGAPPSPEPSPHVEAADVFREDWLPRPIDEFGEYLRGLRVPYVDVCEAERAVFTTDQPMERFDYLVYSESGPNLLVVVIGEDGPLNSDLSLLEDWQRLFGRDFAGTMVFQRDSVWVALTLDDWQDFPNLAHARAFDLLL